MTQLLLDTELNDEQREFLDMVKVSADGLLAVINDILDFSKIEAGKLDLDPIEFELRDTVADALRSLSLRSNAKNLELACQVPAHVPDFVIGDPARLRQVLVNLVGNAIKFTEQGEVVVRVDVETTDNAPPTLQAGADLVLHFTVTDTGIGIPPEKLPYVFDPFVQADSSTTRKHGGTGLGLAITGRLVEMMGGRLWAESVFGQGSTFHFTVRLKLQDRSPSRLLPRRPRDLQGVSVLVVDDNTTNRRILEELLKSWAMKPTLVDGGRAALAALETAAAEGEPFPLVLLDVNMPDMDGYVLASEIRTRFHFLHPELLVLSSADRAGDGERCRVLGITRRLSKPVKPSDLLDAIVRALDPEQEAPSSSEPSSVAVAPSGGESVAIEERVLVSTPVSRRSLRILLAEDNLVNQRIALAVLEKQGHRVVAVVNGAAAVRAVQQEVFDVVLMDVQMPEMNGLEATRAIRSWECERGGHVPIVAMTAHAMKGARDDCLAAGMDHYLSKPIQIPDVIRVLDEVASVNGSGEETVTPSPQPVAFDPEPLLQRIGGDEELLRELVEMFLSEGPPLLEKIRAAIEVKDAEVVERAAHLLKGSACNFAAAEVVRAAQRLENLARTGELFEAGDAYRALEESLSGFRAALDEWLSVRSV
jgi:CheY-like chemotaxis protein/HPt (histidine-containing phosphotransfer) domain-containing protein